MFPEIVKVLGVAGSVADKIDAPGCRGQACVDHVFLQGVQQQMVAAYTEYRELTEELISVLKAIEAGYWVTEAKNNGWWERSKASVANLSKRVLGWGYVIR